MIYRATQEIFDTLTDAGLKAFIEERDELSMVCVSFPLENGSPIQIRFVSTDHDSDVAVRAMELMRVEESRVKAMLPVINHINETYRFVKFTMDRDNDINVQYDFPLSAEGVGKHAMEITARFVKIIREVYPELMRTIWQ